MIKHLACVMDGNRRWAQQQGWQALLGHKEGVEAVKRVIAFSLKNRIEHLSLYTFSLENFKRSEQEKSYLFNLIAEKLSSQELLDQFINQGIRVHFVGDRTLFPRSIIDVCQDIEEKTAHLKTLQVHFLFCYGGRQEIVHSIKEIARKVAHGSLSVDQISDEHVQQSLWTAAIPDPDLVIRTGKVMRLSNFLLYQTAYSEYFFLDCFWPEITTQHLEKVMDEFTVRQRRFGA